MAPYLSEVFVESVHVHAGELSGEMSRTMSMSLPAIGFGTEGVTATSSAGHGPDGMATRVTGSSATCL